MIGTRHRPDRAGLTPPAVAFQAAAVVVAAGGCALLVARPVFLRDADHPVATLVVLFVALLLVGVLWPLSGSAFERGMLRPAPVFAVGLVAFAFARLVGGGEAPGTALLVAIVLNTLAAVAEEAFFRRFLYAVLLPAGAGVAVAGTAVLFALVHITVYGAWVLPIDVMAGLLLSWQRWASGSWKVPAVTHALANFLVVI